MRKPHPVLFDYDVNDLVRICRISLKTAQRWKAGQTVPSPSSVDLLERDLGCFSPAWRGWRIRGENLISPEGWQISMGEARSYPLLLRQIATAREEARRLKVELETQEQPLPADWPAWTLALKA